MIDAQLLETYITELDALRRHGREFAEAYPEIASRLDIGSRRSRDPHVERVVESSAFLASRLRMMIEESATELPLAMLSLLAPSLTEPVPAMGIVEFQGGEEPQTVARGSRFDFEVGDQALACFSTAMDTVAAPMSLAVRRVASGGGPGDTIGVRVEGTPTDPLLLYLGNDAVSGATLLDAFDDDLTAIDVVPPDDDSDPIHVPLSSLRMHGFNAAEASLPVRPAAHLAHRSVVEYMVCPEKFRFVSLSGVPLASGSEVMFRFSRPVALPPALAPDLITVNRAPVVNLWEVAATPFDITGRALEYPVQVDALRYRTVECHSVERVDVYGPGGGRPERIDPAVALGEISGSQIRWGVRRTVSRTGGQVLMYFEGLDYRELGRQRFLVAPVVLASNRDVAQHTPVGEPLQPVGSMGNWRCALAAAPTEYRPALAGAQAMETMIGYLRSNMTSLASGRLDLLRDYLGRFPGADRANWVNGLAAVATRPVATMRMGYPQAGVGLTVTFDKQRYPTTSLAGVRRLLNGLFNSQRGINRVEDVDVRAALG